MSQLTFLFSLTLAYTCCTVLCDSSAGIGGGGGSANLASNPSRKVKVLSFSPAVARLYRMLRKNVGDDDDVFADDETYLQKRQYDDYGHMRFGKRNPKDFDDYGHMRFGK